MNALTDLQTRESNKFALLQHMTDTVKTLVALIRAYGGPKMLDESIAREMGMTREKVEFRLQGQGWRNLGRFL